MEPEATWSRFFLPGAGADPIWSESAPGPRTSGTGSAQKSGGSATLQITLLWALIDISRLTLMH